MTKVEEKPEQSVSIVNENRAMMRTFEKRSWVIGGTLALVIVSIGMFLLGMAVGGAMQHKSSNSVNGPNSGQFGPMNRQGGFGGARQMGTRGAVTAISSSSITIKTSDGTPKTYTINSSTTVRALGRGGMTVNDITVGMTVAVRTSADADSTAMSIIIFDTNSDAASGSSQSY